MYIMYLEHRAVCHREEKQNKINFFFVGPNIVIGMSINNNNNLKLNVTLTRIIVVSSNMYVNSNVELYKIMIVKSQLDS